MASEKLPVQLACRVLGVAESGFYERRTRSPSVRALRHAWLTEQIFHNRRRRHSALGMLTPSEYEGLHTPATA